MKLRNCYNSNEKLRNGLGLLVNYCAVGGINNKNWDHLQMKIVLMQDRQKSPMKYVLVSKAPCIPNKSGKLSWKLSSSISMFLLFSRKKWHFKA